MTNTATSGVARYIGGESGHRSFFGGTQSKARVGFMGLFFIATLVLTPIIGFWGLAIGVVGGGLTMLLTAKTHRGSVVDRRKKRARWASRVKLGTDAYEPYDVAEWDQREQALREAKGRVAKWTARRELAAMRANPDGADGMGWLQFARAEPGIAWHAPTGEQSYLSVAFTVTGQMSGVESASVMRRAAEAWGQFLASRATPSNLVGDVQTLTRVLPADSALQEFWVLKALDPTAPADAIKSYEDVLNLTGQDAMVQRHYVIVRWPLNAAFRDAARKYGEGRDGWRGLMRQEIASTVRGLTDARLGQVETLTARKLAAVILHQQNPSRPIDYVTDVDPASFGIRSHDEFSAHVVEGTDPITGADVEWWHRTAVVKSENLAVGARSQLWMLDLLIGSDIQFVRSVSFHLHLVPKNEARASAKIDLTRDRAAALSNAEKGQVADDETSMNMSAAARRSADLAHGSPHHGGAWVGYITISERNRDALMRASRALEETCSSGLGIDRLEWEDSYQSAASGTTWPIGRGLAAAPPSLAARFATKLAGKSEKEAIS